jgi:hypothetical protein
MLVLLAISCRCNKNTTTYIDLSHPGNITTNFFNSSIYNPGISRNPNLVNNTGIDLSMFNVPNAGNINIANGQTSTILNTVQVQMFIQFLHLPWRLTLIFRNQKE